MYSYNHNAPLKSISSNKSEVLKRKRFHLIKALYGYTARTNTDMSFEKGDRMEVLDDSNPDWWMVRHTNTNSEGYVPVKYIADESSLQCEDWYFPEISRSEAEHLILSSKNTPVGSYLVREVKNSKGHHKFTVCVKGWDREKGYHVKHYRIYHDEKGFYISQNQIYISLPSLIIAYTNYDTGTTLRLTQPCPKPTPQMYDLALTTYDNWEIPRTEIKLIRKLGTGSFGEVWYGKWKDKTEVAVKTLKQGTMTTTADFLKEASIMKKLRHKNLVALYAVCSRNEPVYIVQEYVAKGSLLEFLRKGDGRNFSFQELVYIAAQIASGMKYVESKLLIHRDLAARNVLISNDNNAKICDFGLARVIENEEYSIKKGTRFPVRWTAPEAFIYGTFSIKSDVWSYGILLMELFTKGKNPYPGMSTREVAAEVPKGYRMPKPVDNTITDEVYDIMLKCWNKDADNRPTFEFLFHFFEEFGITSETMYKNPEDTVKEEKNNTCCWFCMPCHLL